MATFLATGSLLPHPPGCAIANPRLLRVGRQLHMTRIAHTFNLCKRCLYLEAIGSILKNRLKYLRSCAPNKLKQPSEATKRGQALTDAITCPLSQTKVQRLLTGLR